jgi:hypothetical protein
MANASQTNKDDKNSKQFYSTDAKKLKNNTDMIISDASPENTSSVIQNKKSTFSN